MSSDPDQVSGDIRRHVSRTVNLRRKNTGSLEDLRNPNPLNSSWIRRLHVTSSPPPPPCTRTISSHESRTAVRYLAKVSRSEEEKSKEVSGFGPYKFKARSTRESAKAEGLNTDRGLEKREDLGFKISPFFRVLPPMANNSELTLSNPSSRHFSMNTGQTACNGEATNTTPIIKFQDKQEEPFSYWNMGRFNKTNIVSNSSSQINNMPRKRNPISNSFFPSKFRKSGDE